MPQEDDGSVQIDEASAELVTSEGQTSAGRKGPLQMLGANQGATRATKATKAKAKKKKKRAGGSLPQGHRSIMKQAASPEEGIVRGGHGVLFQDANSQPNEQPKQEITADEQWPQSNDNAATV